MKDINEKYYSSIPYILVDKKYELTKILKTNYYNYGLPLIFLNEKYSKKLISFLKIYPKYKKFINHKSHNIFIKYFLISYSKIKQKYNYNLRYLHDHNYPLFAEVVENVDFYNLKIINNIINNLKEFESDFRKLINDWIICIFE